jgi:hypothetical protein
MKVVETLLFYKFVNCLIHAWKVIHEVPQLLMRNSPAIPLVKIFEDPQISVSPPREMATNKRLHNILPYPSLNFVIAKRKSSSG